MRFLSFLVFTVFFTPLSVNGASLKNCFKKGDEDRDISVCVTKAHAEREAILNIIENEFEDFIRDDKYLEVPRRYQEASLVPGVGGKIKVVPVKDDTGVFIPSNQKAEEHDSHIDKKLSEIEDSIIDRKLEEKQRKKSNEIARAKLKKQKHQYEHEMRLYAIKKQKAIESLIESRAKYQEYKELECNRQMSVYKDSANKYLAEITLKSCYYDMANHRIKVLQRSMGR